MKIVLTYILHCLGNFLSLIRAEQLARICSFFRNHIYTGLLHGKFREIGPNSIFLWRAYHLHGLENISIGENCTFETGLQLTTWTDVSDDPIITIGNNCLFRRDAHITAVHKITIGNNLLTGTNVFITDNSHGFTDKSSLEEAPLKRPIFSKGDVKIGDNVWIGNNVCILPGITIGNGCVIGANSVVTHSLPPYSVAGGAPAKIIKQNNIL